MQRTYYEDDGPAWEWWGAPAITLPEDRTHIVVKHGLTLDNLDHLSRLAVLRCRSHYLSPGDLYMLAYEAITVAVLEAETAPDNAGLIEAGQRGILRESSAQVHHHGMYSADRTASAPRFTSYWRHIAGATPSAEERIIERVALSQIWPLLTDGERDALSALAVTGTRAAAAQALKITTGTLNQRLRGARVRAHRLWHEHETPPTVAVDRRVRSYSAAPVTRCVHGHDYTPENTIWGRKAKRGTEHRVCRVCRDRRNAERSAKRRAGRAVAS